MNIQTIEKDGKPIFAIIPYEEYTALAAVAEDALDVQHFNDAQAAIASGEETFPGEFVEELLNSESLLRTWREYRGLTQEQLANSSGLSQAAVAQIEAGNREPKVRTAARLAATLNCDIDDLVKV